VAWIVLLFPLFLHAAKIKDICNVIGVRDNQLIGYGLVVGLNKTGDGTTSKFTLQTIANMLQSMNVKLDPKDIKSKNVAAVMVTATLPPFARQGDRIDVVVSSMGDAKSIEGGTLLMTPLKGVDGRIYALAQGSVTIGVPQRQGSGNAQPRHGGEDTRRRTGGTGGRFRSLLPEPGDPQPQGGELQKRHFDPEYSESLL